MNSLNDNIHNALGVAQDKKIRVRAVGRGGRLKCKPHFPPKADRNWKPSMHLLRVWKGKWGCAQYLYSSWS